jgi:AcrR family transcriptional regulator
MSPRHSAAEAAATRATIVDHGVARASIEGLEGLTIGTLAGELGLSKAGVVGPFGSKEALQLAVLKRATEIFREDVWDPAADLPAGRKRLVAVCENWISHLSRRVFPGGCFVTTAATEWDAREGPLHDAVAAAQGRWLATLRADAEVAVRAGELPPRTDPAQLAFELNGVAMCLNQMLVLFDDKKAPARARRAVKRLLEAQPTG